MTTIEYLPLLLAVDVEKFLPRHFINGYNLQRDIISYMLHLRQFHFHIRSIVAYAPHIDINTIRQSFVRQEQSVDCVLDYFNNICGQSQIDFHFSTKIKRLFQSLQQYYFLMM